MNYLHEAHQGIKDALVEGISPRTVVMAVANVAFLGISLGIQSYVDKHVSFDQAEFKKVINEGGEL